MRVALIDYRAGNLTSVRKALAAISASVWTPQSPDELMEADGVIVPGVGHFQATAALNAEWRKMIGAVVAAGRPLLGICLGLQWLFETSDEAPALTGLGLIAGRCHLLASDMRPDARNTEPGPGSGSLVPCSVKVPHVGWNALRLTRPSRLLEGVDDGAQVYFTHSYVAPVTPDCVATTTHGEVFAAAVERDLIFGVQFHPEKSGDVGLRVLKNFVSVLRNGR